MTLNDLVQATQGRLKQLWPDRTVQLGTREQGGDHSFCVGVVQSSQTAGLGRRQRRAVRIQVRFFLEDRDLPEYLTWAEQMYGGFQFLDWEGQQVRLRMQTAGPGEQEQYYQFQFDVELDFVAAEESGETMGDLIQKEEVKA